MAKLETVSGKFIDILDPTPEDILLEDISWSLSRQARFNGHTISEQPYSTGLHSIFVADMIWGKTQDPYNAQFGLLHDSSEMVISDLPSPVKHIPALRDQIDKIENNILNIINLKFVGRLPTTDEWDIVKYYDRRSCQIEAFHFMNSRGKTKEWGFTQAISLVDLQAFPLPESSVQTHEKFLKKYEYFKNLIEEIQHKG